jgi:hypothetical protein
VANTNESFIDEVAEAVRRDRINLWFRRWGWVIAVVVLAIVGAAAVVEWRQSQTRAAAEFRGEALLSALEAPAAEDRLAALSELPVAGDEGAVAAFLLAAEQQDAGDAEAAAATLNAVAADAAVRPLYRDLAAFKALLIQGEAADPAALEALAAPGAPFRLLASEQLALLDLGQDRRDEALARLQAIRDDAEVGPAQRARVEALLTALGAPPAAEAPPAPDVPAPVGE